MVDNEKRKEIEEITLFEEEKKERLTNEIIEENFDILDIIFHNIIFILL